MKDTHPSAPLIARFAAPCFSPRHLSSPPRRAASKRMVRSVLPPPPHPPSARSRPHHRAHPAACCPASRTSRSSRPRDPRCAGCSTTTRRPLPVQSTGWSCSPWTTARRATSIVARESICMHGISRTAVAQRVASGQVTASLAHLRPRAPYSTRFCTLVYRAMSQYTFNTKYCADGLQELHRNPYSISELSGSVMSMYTDLSLMLQ